MPLRLPLPKKRLLRLLIRQKRFQSSQAPTESKSQQRISRVLDRLPRFMHPYTSGLRHAPGTHITSFLILHELTAIVPLLLLGSAFHYSGWLPGGMDEERVLGYMRKFGSYFSRKGWFGVSTSVSTSVDGEARREVGDFEGEHKHMTLTHDEGERIVGEQKYGSGTRIVLEVATAYAITKALLPLRIIGSVWATPWFARRVLGMFKRFKR